MVAHSTMSKNDAVLLKNSQQIRQKSCFRLITLGNSQLLGKKRPFIFADLGREINWADSNPFFNAQCKCQCRNLRPGTRPTKVWDDRQQLSINCNAETLFTNQLTSGTNCYLFNMSLAEKLYSKLKWTPQEEELLRDLKEMRHIESWKLIAGDMNRRFPQKNRSGKQCRERYMNYVRFGQETPKMSGWTPAQDRQLFLKFMEHGAKWVQIGRQMPGRSENCLKNRFYGAMRKIIRKINRAAKEKKLRHKKPIKTEVLIRILQHSQGKMEVDFSFLPQLQQDMIKMAIKPEQNASLEQIESLINGISKFCQATKASGQKKGQSRSGQFESGEDGLENQNEVQKQGQNQQSAVAVDNLHSFNRQALQDLDSNDFEIGHQRKQRKSSHRIVQNLILFAAEPEKYNQQQVQTSGPHHSYYRSEGSTSRGQQNQ